MDLPVWGIARLPRWTEQIKNFGDTTKSWSTHFFNKCVSSISKLWRKSQVIVFLKPGTAPNSPSYSRPISLLCYLFNLYRRLIRERIFRDIVPKTHTRTLTLRPNTCFTSQVFNLTENIEEGHQEKMIKWGDFRRSYCSFRHHRLFLQKIFSITEKYFLTKVIKSLLQNI